MANKRAWLLWILLLGACTLGALATLAVGLGFALTAAKTGVVDRVAIILSAVSLGLSVLSTGGLLLLWRQLRHG